MTADCSSTPSLFGSQRVSSKKLPRVSTNVLRFPVAGAAAALGFIDPFLHPRGRARQLSGL